MLQYRIIGKALVGLMIWSFCVYAIVSLAIVFGDVLYSLLIVLFALV